MKKAFWIVLFLALVAAGWWWRTQQAGKGGDADGGPGQQQEAQQQTAQVTRGDLTVKVEATGQVVAGRDVDIKSKASGEIVQAPFEEGDVVKKGQLLMVLDPADEQRRVEQAQVSLAVTRAKLAQAQKDLAVDVAQLKVERDRARQAVALAQVQLDDNTAKENRLKKLFDQQFASAEQLETAATATAQAAIAVQNAHLRLRELDNNEQALALKRLAVQSAQAQVRADTLTLQDALERLRETRIVSPMSGVITSLPVQQGQIIASAVSNVGGGTTVMTLSDVSHLFVDAQVDESLIARVRPGQRAVITADAHPGKTFTGKVRRVAPRGVEEQNVVTFEVRIEVLGPQRRLLKPLMTANVGVVLEEKRNVLLLPIQAVQRRGPMSFVQLPPKPGAEGEEASGGPPEQKQRPQGREQQQGQGQRPGGANGPGGGNGNETPEPEMTPIRTGSDDGAFVEILDGLKEGDTVLVVQAQDQNNPWRRGGMGLFGPMPGGGRRR